VHKRPTVTPQVPFESYDHALEYHAFKYFFPSVTKMPSMHADDATDSAPRAALSSPIARAGQISIFAAIYVYQYTYINSIRIFIHTYIYSISSVYLQYMQYISVYGGSGLAKKVLLTLTSFILTSIGCAILLS
jgi:hypothetical protein